MPCDASDPLQCLILAARRLATPAPKNQASSGLLSASASVSWRPKYASCFLQLSKPQEWTEWCTLGPGGWTNKSGFINAITAITTIRVEVSVWDRTSPGSFQIEKKRQNTSESLLAQNHRCSWKAQPPHPVLAACCLGGRAAASSCRGVPGFTTKRTSAVTAEESMWSLNPLSGKSPEVSCCCLLHKSWGVGLIDVLFRHAKVEVWEVEKTVHLMILIDSSATVSQGLWLPLA